MTNPGSQCSRDSDLAAITIPHPAVRVGTAERRAPREGSLLKQSLRNRKQLERKLGRAAAYRALRLLGFPEPPVIGRGDRGMPLWPPEVTGSITHGGGTAVAAVASTLEVEALGIDFQPLRPLRRDICDRVCTPSEREWVKESPASQDERSLLLFSAKESIFKALFPLTRRMFGFQAAELVWRSEQRQFRATLTGELSSRFPRGFEFDVGVVRLTGACFTFVVLAPPHRLSAE